ncbi:MAG: hypothetical protein KAJ18_02675, partial [Candidatus Omnitrophica bacterium]|nr:hypothetical protein [Candidatus Omnitrophota bacterium]
MRKTLLYSVIFISLCCSGECANLMPHCTEEDGKVMDSYCADIQEGDAGGVVRCLEEHMDKVSSACAEDIKKNIEKFDRQTDHCRAAVKEYCGYKLNIRKPPSRKRAEKLSKCLIMNWDRLEEECRQYVRMSIPFFVLMEPGLEERAREMREKKSRERKVRINGKKVTVVKEEGDDVWYRAKIVDREVVDAYELCPEVDLEGLKPSAWNGWCSYSVKASWSKELIEELRGAGLLGFINDNGLYNGGIIRNKDQILEMVEQYSYNCPEGFKVNVYYHERWKIKAHVACSDNLEASYHGCDEKYVYTGTEKKFFGCQKFAECNEMDPKYVAYGDSERCGYCQAGGCMDHTMKDVGHRGIKLLYCRVNKKDPKTYPYCEGSNLIQHVGWNKGISKVEFKDNLPIKRFFYAVMKPGSPLEYVIEYNEYGMPSVKKDM